VYPRLAVEFQLPRMKKSSGSRKQQPGRHRAGVSTSPDEEIIRNGALEHITHLDRIVSTSPDEEIIRNPLGRSVRAGRHRVSTSPDEEITRNLPPQLTLHRRSSVSTSPDEEIIRNFYSLLLVLRML